MPVVGFQIFCEFGAASQASHASTLPVGRSDMWTATIGQLVGDDHWPTWFGGGPAGPSPPAHAENGPSVFGEPLDQVAGSDVRVVCALVSPALPPAPCVRKRSVPAPAGPRSAIQ